MERIEQVKEYYPCLESMKRKFDRFARKDAMKAKTREEYDIWAINARKCLSELFGMDKMEDCESKVVSLEVVELEEGRRREKILLQVEPKVYMPCYILYPGEAEQKYAEHEGFIKPACAIAAHGHQGGGKESIAGRSEIKAIKMFIDQFQYDYDWSYVKKVILPFVRMPEDMQREERQHFKRMRSSSICPEPAFIFLIWQNLLE